MTEQAVLLPGAAGRPGPRWWQRGVIYEVYPRSFQDSDGDGVGDLRGIVSRLDHLAWLGVDALWVCPFYPSPMADFGYDVADHTAVDPRFGTMADFDALVEEAHRRGLRVILDYVPNHTSHEHPWFAESRASRESPRRDWYVWRDPGPGGGPPNNWRSAFGGSAWKWDDATGQYYLHTFLREQPDLNWRNPAVEREMLDVLRFWLERGVDGFRVDAVQNVVKDDLFRDDPPNPDHRTGDDPFEALLRIHSADRPEIHDVIARMRAVVDAYDDRVLIGEIYNTVERLMPYYGAAGGGVHFPHNFQLIRLPWNARVLDAAIRRYESLLPPGAWPNWVLGNHDRRRIASRVGRPQGRVAAMLLLTMRGTPTLYYGDEIGMEDVPIAPERVQDPWERNLPGRGLGRDPVRTPMQWEGGRNAGFTTAEPWLPLAEDASTVNVFAQAQDAASILALHRRLLDLRRAEPALHGGSWTPVGTPANVLAYLRDSGESRFLVALNVAAEPCEFECAEVERSARIALSTYLDREGEELAGRVSLRGDEGLVVRIS